MFAVIKTGGKQYKVTHNDVIKVEKLAGNVGDKVTISEILALGEGHNISIGSPFIDNTSVEAAIIDQKKDEKVIIFKKRRRHHSRQKNGHRQEVTFLRVVSINGKQDAVQSKPKGKVSASKTD